MCAKHEDATIVLQSPSSRNVFLGVRNEWWKRYIRTVLGIAPEYFVPAISPDFTKVIPLGEVRPQSPLDHCLFLVNHSKKMDLIVFFTIFSFKRE